MADFGRYFIAVLPDTRISKHITNIRETYIDILDVPKTPIHLTLRESFFTKRIEDCICALEKAFMTTPAFDINSHSYDIFSGKHFVLKLSKNALLQSMHEKTMQIIRPYIENGNLYTPLESITKRQKQLLKDYNNPYCFEFYNPHISIGSIKQPEYINSIKDFLADEHTIKKFHVNSVAIVDKNSNEIHHKIKLF
jgi:hypothetical protein